MAILKEIFFLKLPRQKIDHWKFELIGRSSKIDVTREYKSFINKDCEVLIDKESKKSNDFWSGRTTENNVVVFPKYNFKLGDTVNIDISDCTTATLIGNINQLKAKI